MTAPRRWAVSRRSWLHTLSCVCVSEVSHLLASLAAPRWCGANGYRVDRCGVPGGPLGASRGVSSCLASLMQTHDNNTRVLRARVRRSWRRRLVMIRPGREPVVRTAHERSRVIASLNPSREEVCHFSS